MNNLSLQSPPKKKHPEIWPFSVSTNQPNTPFTQDILSEQIFVPSRNKIWNQVIHLPTAGKKRLERFFACQKRGVLSDKIP